MTIKTLLALAALAAATPALAAPEVRFCPKAAVWAHSEEDARRVRSLLLQSITVANPSGPAFRAQSLEIALMEGETARDVRVLDARILANNAEAGPILQGLSAVLPGQFCDGAAFGGLTLTSTLDIAPGQALLIHQQSFGWNGPRDAVRVTVRGAIGGKPAEASARIPIRTGGSLTAMRFPLSGSWYVGAAGTAHSHHRWITFEEFALDIVQLGEGGLSYRGDGARLTDYVAYGKPVLAVADGVATSAGDGAAEDARLMRGSKESQADYRQRVLAGQDALLAAGPTAMLGNYVVIDHANGEFSVYAHLKPGSVNVAKGQAVKAGQPIGAVGSSGNSTEPHLHFQVCDSPDPVTCGGVPPRFTNVEIPWEHAPRTLQSGDIVVTN
jgi:murein DD-endopeptidase MepM/ murein hydrolase activator NlpD